MVVARSKDPVVMLPAPSATKEPAIIAGDVEEPVAPCARNVKAPHRVVGPVKQESCAPIVIVKFADTCTGVGAESLTNTIT